ncbi:MAG: hypothetical protein D6678_06810 [Zetaproteobacteria bacterium]|nr:MAG: hypothetical protein D6678_06810 [Zetaproteobacteria bacterium]
MKTHIQQDIERYRRAVEANYGTHYLERLAVRHVAGDTVAIRFPKGGQVLIQHERLHALTDYLMHRAKVSA